MRGGVAIPHVMVCKKRSMPIKPDDSRTEAGVSPARRRGSESSTNDGSRGDWFPIRVSIPARCVHDRAGVRGVHRARGTGGRVRVEFPPRRSTFRAVSSMIAGSVQVSKCGRVHCKSEHGWDSTEAAGRGGDAPRDSDERRDARRRGVLSASLKCALCKE